MDDLFQLSIFPLYLGLKLSFEHNGIRKNLSLGACFCWDSGLFLLDLDQKLNFSGTIGYDDLSLEFFRQFKVFRLHAVLDNAAAAVKAQYDKGPGYCYMIGRGPN